MSHALKGKATFCVVGSRSSGMVVPKRVCTKFEQLKEHSCSFFSLFLHNENSGTFD